MIHTLLLRMAAPMQSWGVQSDFTNRDTGLEPSKSGVIGLLCAALGKPRTNIDIDKEEPTLIRLQKLRMGVRVDREGLLMCDFHTAGKGGYLKAKGVVEEKDLIVSERFYLADATFLVGLEGEDLELLRKINYHLQHPHWFLFFGRKAFVPGEPVWIKKGIQESVSLEQALREFNRLRPAQFDDKRMRTMVEVKPGEQGELVRHDVPISFIKGKREFETRYLRVGICDDRPLLVEEEDS